MAVAQSAGAAADAASLGLGAALRFRLRFTASHSCGCSGQVVPISHASSGTDAADTRRTSYVRTPSVPTARRHDPAEGSPGLCQLRGMLCSASQ